MDTVEANPDSQRKTLWCWAASMSMIFSSLGRTISQESIVRQVYGDQRNWPSGPLPATSHDLNRTYMDDSGAKFTVSAKVIDTPEDAVDALSNGKPIIYFANHHAMVQTSVTYQVASGGPKVVKGGRLWDPEPQIGWRNLSATDVQGYIAAWAISISGSTKAGKIGPDQPPAINGTVGLCEGVRKAASLSHSNFSSILGTRITKGYWNTAFTVGDFSDCKVIDYTDDGDFTLRCEGSGVSYLDTKKLLQSCLFSWKSDVFTDYQENEFIEFKSPEATTKVHLKISKSGALDLEIEK